MVQYSSKDTTPSKSVLCVMLAGHNHMAGAFLASILHWSNYASATIKGVPGTWVANPRTWWMRECCLTPSQYNRSLSKLVGLGLVERRQWWFKGGLILFLRPTDIARNYIASATTWAAAKQLLPNASAASGHVANDKPSFTKIANSNESLDGGNPGSSETPLSNYISNSHVNLTIKSECAAPASPTCASGSLKSKAKKEISGEIEFEQAIKEFDLQLAATVWASTLAEAYSEEPIELTPKEMGALALLAQTVGQFCEEHLEPCNRDVWLLGFIFFAIQHWHIGNDNYKFPMRPDVRFLLDHPAPYLQAWYDA